LVTFARIREQILLTPPTYKRECAREMLQLNNLVMNPETKSFSGYFVASSIPHGHLSAMLHLLVHHLRNIQKEVAFG
jgi:hypothetical protein